ncbi:MAG: hypothetical protein IJP27_00595, partial [Clostridia bacterium]|nr:hypothetical protein [Clostridia bacterium]
PALAAFPEEERWGGRVHRLEDNMFHLINGEVYDIMGKKCFVMGGAYAGLAIGNNAVGTVDDVFYKQMDGMTVGTTMPTGTGDEEGFIPMQALDMMTLYQINRKAGENVLTLSGGKLIPVGGRDVPVPVKLTTNNKTEEYLLSGSSYTVDTSSFKNPVVTLNGVLLENMEITVPATDSEIVIREKTSCTTHDFSIYQPVDEEIHWMVCANNPAHYLDEAHDFEIRDVGSGCYEAGYKAKVCRDCGYEILLEEIPVEGHEFGEWQPYDANDHQRLCVKDNTHVEYAPHVFDEGTEWAPGCGEFGYIRYECECGYYYDEITAARQGTAHQWETENVDPTCEEAGGLRTFCDDCGRSTVDGTIPALGHDWSDWVSVNDTTHKSTCGNNKDHVRTESHKMDGGVVYAPKCGVKGYTRHSCTECNYYVDTDILPALTHEWGAWTVEQPAVGDVSGLKKRQCSICEEYETRVIPGNLDPAVIAGVVWPEDGYVTVTVKMRNNPGLASLQLAMTYDPEVLQPMGDAVEKGAALGGLTFGNGLEGNPQGSFKMTWVGAANDDSDGTLFSVKFKVLQSGTTAVTLEVVPNTAFDENLQPVTLYDRYAESIEVHAHRFEWNESTGKFECSCGGVGQNDGDVDRDGDLDTADVTLILQYLTGQTALRMDPNGADFNGDGKISVADAVQLLRYIAA